VAESLVCLLDPKDAATSKRRSESKQRVVDDVGQACGSDEQQQPAAHLGGLLRS
jgi:hypothetical protein